MQDRPRRWTPAERLPPQSEIQSEICSLKSAIQRGIEMEVILRDHVDNLGRRGEIVKVADGYARNYLLPRKLALLATEGNKKQIERERAKFEAKEADERKIVDAEAARLNGVEVLIARRVGDTQALYGSVTTTDIAEALAVKGFNIDRRKLQLADPIKKIGDVDVPVKLHRDVTATIKVRVVAEGAAAPAAPAASPAPAAE
jgi:large subunit ribosomal protein L9